MGNTHLTVQGRVSYAKHAACVVGMEGAQKGQAEMLPGALPTFLRRMSYLGSRGERQPALAQREPCLTDGRTGTARPHQGGAGLPCSCNPLPRR